MKKLKYYFAMNKNGRKTREREERISWFFSTLVLICSLLPFLSDFKFENAVILMFIFHICNLYREKFIKIYEHVFPSAPPTEENIIYYLDEDENLVDCNGNWFTSRNDYARKMVIYENYSTFSVVINTKEGEIIVKAFYYYEDKIPRSDYKFKKYKDLLKSPNDLKEVVFDDLNIIS